MHNSVTLSTFNNIVQPATTNTFSSFPKLCHHPKQKLPNYSNPKEIKVPIVLLSPLQLQALLQPCGSIYQGSMVPRIGSVHHNHTATLTKIQWPCGTRARLHHPHRENTLRPCASVFPGTLPRPHGQPLCAKMSAQLILTMS